MLKPSVESSQKEDFLWHELIDFLQNVRLEQHQQFALESCVAERIDYLENVGGRKQNQLVEKLWRVQYLPFEPLQDVKLVAFVIAECLMPESCDVHDRHTVIKPFLLSA